MSFRYQMSSHNKVLLSAPSLFIQDWSSGGGDRVNTFVKQSMYTFFDGGSHVSGRKIWINFEAHQGFILLINPCLEEMRWFEAIFKMVGRAFFEVVEVKGYSRLNFEILTLKKEFLNFDGLQSLLKSFFQTLVGCPFFSSFDYYIDYKSAVYKCIL